MIYSKHKGPKGGVVYRANNKFIKTSKVPDEVKKILETEDVIKFSPCIFCGQQATRTRYLNGLIVDLCDSDYYSHNLGQVAQKLREGENDGFKPKVPQTGQKESKPLTTKSQDVRPHTQTGWA